MLKQLEGDGIVTRQRSPADERRVMVGLTDRGREIVERQRRSLRSAQRRHYAALTPEQRTLFVDVLEQMATMIDQWSDFTDEPE
jgi:DNA-binding MarR family transcriptional regulator